MKDSAHALLEPLATHPHRSSQINPATPLSANADDPMVQPPNNVLVNSVVLPPARPLAVRVVSVVHAPAHTRAGHTHEPTKNTMHEGTPYSRLTIPLSRSYISYPTPPRGPGSPPPLLVTQQESFNKI